ncbi:MAG: DUF2167 domain-containing protein [Planctomycetes bacterium]|nr:DUF2167 domain-containing protein [Planctomycetota bacterium]
MPASTSPLVCRLFLLLCALGASLAAAQAEEPTARKPTRAMTYQQGKVTLGSTLATVDLPEGYRFLGEADAHYVIEDLWGNPPGAPLLGLIVPPNCEVDQEDGWAIIASYDDEDGHVKDDDAKKLDYGDLLKTMQEGARSSNEARQKAGYPSIELMGWAEAPHYDAESHKLYFAKRIRFGGSAESLNYNVRILGRKGYLLLNAVAPVDQLATVAEGSKSVLAKTEFTAGNGYNDFKPGYDKVAAYGIGGLIAGGLLAKAGFFTVIGKFLLLAIKPIIIGVVLLGGVIAKFFGGRKKRDEAAQS